MKRVIAVGAAMIAGALALRLLAGERRRLIAAIGLRVRHRMERMMASLPEDSPPRLVMSVLPRLREQNDQIIAMLREQNELLKRLPKAGAPRRAKASARE